MKVELTPTPQKEKPFEPFSVTFTFETEQEACNMWHRLNVGQVGFKETDGVRLPINFGFGISKEWREFNQIMFEKGLAKRKSFGK